MSGLAVGHRGGGILFAHGHRTYRVHPFVDGNIGPPTPDLRFDTSPELGYQYQANCVTSSRDGRVIISIGTSSGIEGAPVAYSLWVEDDGTVRPVSVIRKKTESDSLAGGVVALEIAPDRSWVVINGRRVVSYRLNPDGTFGEELWRTESRDLAMGLSVSGDGRLIASGSIVTRPSGDNLSVAVSLLTLLHVDGEGRLISRTEHEFERGFESTRIFPEFITRRGPGDANGDGWIDVADLVTLVNHVERGAEIGNPVDLDNADVNRDGARNKVDVVMLVERLLGSL